MACSCRIGIIPKYSALLCMMVVMIHNSIPHYFSYNADSLESYIHYGITHYLKLLYACAVPSFFIISGFLFFRNYQKDDYVRKLKSRVHTLLIPYLLWNLFGLLTEMLSKIPFFSSMATINSTPFSWQSVLLGIFFHKYTILWFVFMIIVYAIAAPILFHIVQRVKVFYVVFSLLLLTFFIFDSDVSYPFGIRVEYSSILYYLLGSYLGLHFKDFFSYRTHVNVYILTLGLMVTVVLENSIKGYFFYSHVFCNLIKLSFLYFIFAKIEDRIIERKWFGATFFIYAFHLPVMRFTTGILRFFFGEINFPLKELTLYLSSFGVVMLVCLVVAHNLEIYTPRIYKLLTGNR